MEKHHPIVWLLVGLPLSAYVALFWIPLAVMAGFYVLSVLFL